MMDCEWFKNCLRNGGHESTDDLISGIIGNPFNFNFHPSLPKVMSVHQAMEHSEHIAHAGHGGEKLGSYIGVTMAILGVLLAFCSAMVGSERTLLLSELVEQQHAHSKYQAQDVKHRVAYSSFSQMHATLFGSDTKSVNSQDVLFMAKSVKRYLEESELAKEWTKAYDPIIKGHMKSQSHYEHGLLAAEIAIVIASVSLLLKRRSLWLVSMALGGVAVVIAIHTLIESGPEVKEAQEKITEARAAYEEARAANKTTAEEQKVVEETIKLIESLPK